ncbi:MAG: nickel-dependent hydrogenase large subunit [Planctomycetes bacterium]|nr:nickel-dependent hydrogenase large subunit [Planctomycetota bacterium]
MARTVTLSPLTRIEGHLAVHTDVEPAGGDPPGGGFRVTGARCSGEMFRGFETILAGRDPLDAQQITQRICGVCPISHGVASCRAQEMAYGIRPTPNGRLLQNLILAANYLQSHVLHFYTLSALDFVDVTAILAYRGGDRTMRSVKAWVEAGLARQKEGKDLFPAAPFLPRYEGDYIADAEVNCGLLAHYVEALDIRRVAHEMAAVFGARLPHSTALVPGGCTQVPTLERILSYRSRLKRIQAFIEDAYVPDVVTAAKAFPGYWEIGTGPGNLLTYGVFELDDAGRRFFEPGAVIDGRWEAFDAAGITEQVKYSKFSSPSGRHPADGLTAAQPGKAEAYSWIKAPRYKGRPMEVGPLARVLANYLSPGGNGIKGEVDAVLGALGIRAEKMDSVLGRHLARALESKWIARQAFRWLEEIEPEAPPARDFEIPPSASGHGLVDAPRGALGHWLKIENYRIKHYQCVVPTTWNCSPRDDAGTPGPVEKALEGTPVANPDQPIEVGRVVRSFDPCLACAVH